MTKFGLSKERRPFECGKNSDEKAVVKSREDEMVGDAFVVGV